MDTIIPAPIDEPSLLFIMMTFSENIPNNSWMASLILLIKCGYSSIKLSTAMVQPSILFIWCKRETIPHAVNLADRILTNSTTRLTIRRSLRVVYGINSKSCKINLVSDKSIV